jgi:hypothetical protein
MVFHACNPSTQEVEAGESWVRGNLSHLVRSYIQKKKKKSWSRLSASWSCTNILLWKNLKHKAKLNKFFSVHLLIFSYPDSTFSICLLYLVSIHPYTHWPILVFDVFRINCRQQYIYLQIH